jgi:hypothetical protein
MPVATADAIAGRALAHESFPASVTVTRTSQRDFSSRQLIVWIDGVRVATLLWGDSITRDLEPGVHRVRVSNTLVWKTAEFTVEPGQQIFFEAVNRTGVGTITMMLLLGVAPLYVTLTRMDL